MCCFCYLQESQAVRLYVDTAQVSRSAASISFGAAPIRDIGEHPCCWFGVKRAL
jgi:hypothetical protein